MVEICQDAAHMIESITKGTLDFVTMLLDFQGTLLTTGQKLTSALKSMI